MTRRSLSAASLFVLACLPALAGPVPKADPVLEAIRKTPALQAPVTLGAADEPLGDFLDRLAKQTRVILKASRETEDDRVTLYAKERPVADLLLEIARHFDFQWRRHKTGFELWQDLPARQRQAAAREAARAAQLQAIRERVERIGALLSEPRERLTQRRSDVMRESAARQLTPEQRREKLEELAVVSAALQPGAALGVGFARLLGPNHYAALRAGTEVRFSTREGTLPPGLAGAIHDAAREARSAMRSVQVQVGPGGTGAFTPAAPAVDPNTAPPTGASATIKFDRGPSGLFAGLGRRANQPPGLHFVFSSLRGGQGDQSVFPVAWTVPAPQGGALPAGAANDPDLEQEVELFPSPRPAAPPMVTPQPGIRTFTVADVLGRQVRLSRVAERLHATTGLHLLSDSFIRARLPETTLRGKHKVSYFLEVIARQLDYGWTKQGGVIRLRDAVYYDDRPAEIPERLLAGWRPRLERNGTFSLDELANIVAALADGQVLNLQNYWQWYLEGGKAAPPEPPHNLFSVREHLRFWATLTAQQKRAATGDIIPARLLNSAQKAAFRKALTSGDGFAFREAVEAAPPTPAELTAGGFRLEVGTSEMHEFRGSAGDSGGQVVIRSIDMGNRAPGTAPPPIAPTLPGGGEIKLQSRSTTTLDNYVFRYHLAGNPQPARTATIQVPRPARPAEPVRSE